MGFSGSGGPGRRRIAPRFVRWWVLYALSGIPARAGTPAGPERAGIFIGIERYNDPAIGTIPWADKDARDLARAFRESAGGRGIAVRLLVDHEASKTALLRAMDELERSRPSELALLYLEGRVARSEGRAWLIPADSLGGRPGPGSAIDLEHFLDRWDRLARDVPVVTILDIDHDGEGLPGDRPGSDLPATVGPRPLQSAGPIRVVACAGGQPSLRVATHGALARALLEGLGQAGEPLPVSRWIEEARVRVASGTAGRQTPRVSELETTRAGVVLLHPPAGASDWWPREEAVLPGTGGERVAATPGAAVLNPEGSGGGPGRDRRAGRTSAGDPTLDEARSGATPGGSAPGDPGAGDASSRDPDSAPDAPTDAPDRILEAMSDRQAVREIVMAYLTETSPYAGGGILYATHFERWRSTGRRPAFADGQRVGDFEIRPLLAADQEGGLVDRFVSYGMPALPSASSVARLAPPAVEELGRRVARQCRQLGIHMILGPVLDLRPEDGASPVELGSRDEHYARHDERSRRYGADPDAVVAVVDRFARALREQAAGDGFDLLLIGKHFPGESSRYNSDHVEITEMMTAGELDRRISVFRRLAPVLDGVMLTNNRYQAAGGRLGFLAPAVLERVPPGLLVMTDDLALPRRIRKNEDIATLAVDALLGGVHMLMVCDTAQREAVERALEQRIREDLTARRLLMTAVRRSLSLKIRLGLVEPSPP